MFYEKFKSLCKANNIPMCKLMKKIGFAKSSVTKWKNGRQPSVPAVIAIAKHFNVTTDSLIMDEPSEGSNNDTNS